MYRANRYSGAGFEVPYPDLYDVTYSYTGFQQSQGDNSFPGTQLDADLAGLEQAIESVSDFAKNVVRADGALNNGIVTYDSLSASLQTAGLSPATAWATDTLYAAGKNVIEDGSFYRAAIEHTSDVFATDLGAGKWVFVAELPVSDQTILGPVSATIGNLPKFSNADGKHVEDSGVPVASLAPLASPVFTGNPQAPTSSPGDNDNTIATTGFVKAAIDVVLGGVSSAFDTLAEIVAALATKVSIASNLSDVGNKTISFDNLSPTTTRGDIVRRGVTNNERLARGASGYHLSSDGADVVWSGFQQTGIGASFRTWQDKARDAFDAKDFGVTADGVTDDAAAIRAAIAAAATAGVRKVNLPAGNCLIKSSIPLNVSVQLVGRGAVYSDGVPANARTASATRITWDAATTGAKMFSFRPLLDNDTDVVLQGGGMRDVLIDGSAVATVGVEVLSCQGLRFDNVHVIEMATAGAGWFFGTLVNGATHGKYTSSYHVSTACSYSATTNSVGLALWGANGLYNTCFSQWVGCNYKSISSYPVRLEDCDSNTFIGCASNGWLLCAQGTASFSVGAYYPCRHNTFWGCIGDVLAQVNTSGTLPSLANIWHGGNLDNNIPFPTIEPGADLTVLLTGIDFTGAYGGIQYGQAHAGTMLTRSSAQSIPNSVATALTFPDPTFDPLGIFDAATSASRMVVPPGIKWARLTGKVTFVDNGTGIRYADILKAGSPVSRISVPAVAGFSQGLPLVDTGWVKVTAGDYFEFRAYQTSGGALDANVAGTWFQMEVK